ncbi:MAG TPA: hypothetical protein GXX19_01795 [Syntrophomonadaceae bacterium]|nr:hypothetical protein [Syntrophomonadaceae bacterium]
MATRHFFAAFLVCVLLLAGGLHLAAQSIQELRGEKVVLEVLPPQVRGLATRVGEVVRDWTRHLPASSLGERIAALCSDGLQGIKSIETIHEFVDWIGDRFGPFLQGIREKLPGKAHEPPA